MCWDYLDKIGKNPAKEILVLRLGPSNYDEREAYRAFYEYLSSRDRFGVVGNANKHTVKDCYIMPLAGTSPVPAALLPMSGYCGSAMFNCVSLSYCRPGLAAARPDLLLTILVRTRRGPLLPQPAAKPQVGTLLRSHFRN